MSASARTSEHVDPHLRLWERQAMWWSRFEPPLRPQMVDVDYTSRVLHELADHERGHLSALVLGVTPELVGMQWPRHTAVIAVDKSRSMIDHVWPVSAPTSARAIQGNWLDLPVADSSCDVVLGDGCFSQVTWPEAATRLAAQIRRVLKRRGTLLMRSFIKPTAAETLDDVWMDLERGQIGSFHVLKWRLNMLMQSSLEHGVRLHDVWHAVVERYPNLHELAGARGWSTESIETIEAYRNSDVRYFFPALTDLRAVLGQHFSEIEVWFPSYELGERCPHLKCTAR